MRKELKVLAALWAFFTIYPALAIKTDHINLDWEYTQLGSDSRFRSVGFLRVETPSFTGACSIVLIHPRVFLTAMHCISEAVSALQATPQGKVNGYVTFEDTGDSDLRNAISIEAFIGNDRYDSISLHNDIAMGTLEKPVLDIKPMVIFDGSPHTLINSSFFSIGYGETGNANSRNIKEQDRKKRGMATTVIRYKPEYAFLEADFVFSNETSPYPYGTIARGDSGGALMKVMPDNSSVFLVGITSSMSYEIKNLPPSPEKTILEAIENLPTRLKEKAEIQIAKKTIISDYFDNVGYGVTNRWMSVADFMPNFIRSSFPVRSVIALKSGQWTDPSLWSGLQGNEYPKNHLAENKLSATYYDTIIRRHVTVDQNIVVDAVTLTRKAALLTIPQGRALHASVMTLKSGHGEINGELSSTRVFNHAGSTLSGSGTIKLHSTTPRQGLKNGGYLRGNRFDEPLVIQGNLIFTSTGGLEVFISPQGITHIIVTGKVTVTPTSRLHFVFQEGMMPSPGKKWTFLTAHKFHGQFSSASILSLVPEALRNLGMGIQVNVETEEEETFLELEILKPLAS